VEKRKILSLPGIETWFLSHPAYIYVSIIIHTHNGKTMSKNIYSIYIIYTIHNNGTETWTWSDWDKIRANTTQIRILTLSWEYRIRMHTWNVDNYLKRWL
jgi:hypothetical protein